ncbi:Uncharacterised protein [Escherichia coli]|uniref:Uncharacterized protein n=1 Tax=Escherichia coli TaxID=562 RepID=A0A484YVR6_ECOLX|nr:Uncharacterised protein [Escherichia coli]
MSIRGSSARSNTLSWPVIEVNNSQDVLCEIYGGWANAGESAELSFQNSPADPGIAGITGEATGFRIAHTTTIAGEITERPDQVFEDVFAVR